MRETAFALGWTPAVFWPATAFDLFAALDGFKLRHGGRGGGRGPTMTRATLDDMMRRFPDKKPSGGPAGAEQASEED